MFFIALHLSVTAAGTSHIPAVETLRLVDDKGTGQVSEYIHFSRDSYEISTFLRTVKFLDMEK